MSVIVILTEIDGYNFLSAFVSLKIKGIAFSTTSFWKEGAKFVCDFWRFWVYCVIFVFEDWYIVVLVDAFKSLNFIPYLFWVCFRIDWTCIGAPTCCFAVFNCTSGLSSAFFKFYEIILGFSAFKFVEGRLFWFDRFITMRVPPRDWGLFTWEYGLSYCYVGYF